MILVLIPGYRPLWFGSKYCVSGTAAKLMLCKGKRECPNEASQKMSLVALILPMRILKFLTFFGRFFEACKTAEQ